MTTTIYGLIDPSGAIRYVGKTSKTPSERLAGHIKDAQRRETHKNKWIRSLIREGAIPRVIVLATAHDDGNALERWFITTMRERGFRLTNGTDGGDGVTGYRHTPETRAKISAAGRGRSMTHSAASRAKISQAKKGNPISVGVRGPLSLGHRAAIAAGNRGKKQSPEAVAKSAMARRGTHHSEETRARISAVLTGTVLSPERVAAAVAGRAGYQHSEETKDRIAASVKAAWSTRRKRSN
jgi:hypothetical protein